MRLFIGTIFAVGALLGTLSAAQNQYQNSTQNRFQTTQNRFQTTTSTTAQSPDTQKLFQQANLLTLEGVITDVNTVERPLGRDMGVHFTLQTDDKQYKVLTGPEFYMDQIGLNLQTNTPVVVEGILIEKAGDQFVIPSKITMNGKDFILRDTQGIPAWRGTQGGSTTNTNSNTNSSTTSY